MPTPTTIDKWKWSDAISRREWDEKYQYFNFIYPPVTSNKVGGASSGTAGDENLMISPEGQLEYHIIGTQSILAPVVTTISAGVSALNIAMDQTNTDGVEVCAGIINSNRNAFKTSTDAAFFFRVRYAIGTVAGTDDCAIGFRKVEAYQAAIDNYGDMAALNTIAGDIKIETILAGAGTVTTDTTDDWADAAVHELKVSVSSAGVCTYLIDGVAPTTTAAFTFAAGTWVVPFFYLLNNATLTATLYVYEWECGYQS